jgi:mRNA deadenylase 3'-5' endonuclease subunit Ccr4
MTYNVLSDQYCEQYAQWLYRDVPYEALPWKHRMPLLLQEILHWSPDILCLQVSAHMFAGDHS